MKKKFSFIQELFVLRYAITDSRTPIYAKLVAGLAFAYLLSPIDIIPDVIPIAGYLDDLVIVPFLLHLSFRWLPVEVIQFGQSQAKRHIVQLRVILAIVVIILLAIMVGLFFLIRSGMQHF